MTEIYLRFSRIDDMWQFMIIHIRDRPIFRTDQITADPPTPKSEHLRPKKSVHTQV